MSGSKSKRETGRDRAKPELLKAAVFGGLDQYKKINLLFLVFFSLSLLFNFLKNPLNPDKANLIPFFIFIGVFLILLLLKGSIKTKRLQLLLLFLLSFFTIFTNPITYQVGYILLIFVYFLSEKYRVFKRRLLSNALIVIFLVLAIIGSLLNYGLYAAPQEVVTIWHVPNQLSFIITSIFLVIIVFEDEIRKLTQENTQLNTQIVKSSIFVDLGENIAGLMHNMNGDLGLISMSVSMLEEDVDHKAVEYIKTGNKKLQAKIRNILTLAKYSQAEEDMDFSLNALLYSLLEVFNINEDYTKILTITDFHHEVFFYGNPSEIAQVFENLIKNAYEALIEKCNAIKDKDGAFFEAQLKVSIIGSKETSQIIFSDNGPGIKACLENKCKGDCINCVVFRVGKTTKSEGTGLGMVSAMRTLDKYKSQMKIKTSTEGSEITLILPRG